MLFIPVSYSNALIVSVISATASSPMRCTYYFFSVVLNLLVYSYLAQRLGMFFALCASTRLGPMLVRVLCGGGHRDGRRI